MEKRRDTCKTDGPIDGPRGGCAFRGAKLALQPIVDAVHLVHGPIICQGHSWESRPTATRDTTLHRHSVSSGGSRQQPERPDP